MISRRRDERGFSIIEAIVISTLTALLALLLLQLLPRSGAGALDIAERSLAVADSMRAEREFRALVRAASPRDPRGIDEAAVEGEAASVLLRPNLNMAVACAHAGAPVVRLVLVRGALLCVNNQQRRPLLTWRDDAVAAFAYSRDGVSWRSQADAGGAASYVRFELRQSGRVVTSWVERSQGSGR